MTTAYLTHPRYAAHAMSYPHPEHPGRIEAVWQVLHDSGVLKRMQVIEAHPVTDAPILNVHQQQYLEMLTGIAQQDRLVMIDSDTYALPQSPQIARLAAGAVVQAVDTVMLGKANNALVAVRPPGHHATPTRAMGFCLLNNIAIGARHAQQAHGLERVMIVDYDVHHGNGTQDAFYDDPNVLFISVHQHPFYPMTGVMEAVGTGAGSGANINIPLQAGHGDSNYRLIFDDIIWQAARRFAPQLILVSAGFDAHYVDPLASMRLSHTGYARITRQLKHMADALCEGKIIFVMEGGYDLPALAHGMLNIAHILLEEDIISDYYGLDDRQEPHIEALIAVLRRLHHL